MIVSIDFKEYLNRRILQGLHGNLIVNFRALIKVIGPFHLSLILILLKAPSLRRGGETCPWDIVIGDHLEL